MPESPVNISLLWHPLCAVFVWIFLGTPVGGYQIRSVGANVQAAGYAGISYSKVTIMAMALSGMLAGFLR